MTPKFVSLVLVLLLSNGASSQPSVKQGFELQFTSSREELENEPMSFSGSAPSWLNGTLVRDGPALFELGNDSVVTSTLDGFAKVALWNFTGNGSILFSTKFIRSTYYKESLASEKFTSNIFVSPPLPRLSPAEVQRSQEVGIDNMDINIVEGKDSQSGKVSYLATNDILSAYEISLDDLSTLGKRNPSLGNAPESEETPEFLKRLSTAHPLPEFNTDNLINVVLQAAVQPQDANVLKVVRINSEGTEEIASFEIPEVPLLHSFGLTPTSVVILMNPYIMNATCRMENEDNCYTWKEGNEPTRIYVVDIQTGSVQGVNIPKTFVYHHINSYNYGPNMVIADVASYDSPIPHTKFELSRLKDESARSQIDPRADMKRIVITLDTATATISSIPSPNPTSELASTLDYPVINEKHRSKKHCYVYGIIEKHDSVNIEAVAVAKKDVCSDDDRASDAIYSRTGWYPSEPTFVPTPGATREDDGVLLVPYTSGESNRTNLVVLDAETLQFIDMAVGPNHIPQSQHGRYLDV